MNDPFVLNPQLWFGLLCEGVAADQRGRLNFQSVFNQVLFLTPPENTGVQPHAFVNGVLVVGFSEGLGHFEADVQLRDVDDNVLWERPSGQWSFDAGPGHAAAVLVEPVNYWLAQPGRYHFWIHLSPNDLVHEIQFEAARQIGQTELKPDGLAGG